MKIAKGRKPIFFKRASFGLFLTLCVNFSAHAFTLQMSSTTGLPYSWALPVKPAFIGNPSNNDGLSSNAVFNALTSSLQRWKYAQSSTIDFTYSQSDGNEANGNFDRANRVFFTSRTSAAFKLGGGTLGVTSSMLSGGYIIETDIWFNDESFRFTTTASDSTAFNFPNVFLESVATHEFGHAFGLSHSGVLQSSMIFEENRGQAYPSCDDVEGLAALYPAASFTTGRGTIVGTVKSGGTNISGAHVLAISKTRGTVVEGAISRMNTGIFTLSNLEPGDYYLMVEPFQTTDALSSLCGSNPTCYWTGLTSLTACPGNTPTTFPRMFPESSAGLPTKFTVSANSTLNIGDVTVGCSAMTDPFVGTGAIGTAPAITAASNNAGSEVAVAVRGVMGGAGTAQYFKLSQVTGTIAVKLLSFSLYSNFDPIVSIVDASDVQVTGSSSVNNVFTSRSSFVNFDSQAIYTNSGAADDYYLKVTNNQVASPGNASYPGSTADQIDSTSFFLLLVTINDSGALLPSSSSPILPNNARCEQPSDSFPALSNSSSSGSSGGGGGGGGSSGGGVKACGTIVSADENGGPPWGAMVFSAWGMMFLLVLSRFAQQLARRFIAR